MTRLARRARRGGRRGGPTGSCLECVRGRRRLRWGADRRCRLRAPQWGAHAHGSSDVERDREPDLGAPLRGLDRGGGADQARSSARTCLKPRMRSPPRPSRLESSARTARRRARTAPGYRRSEAPPARDVAASRAHTSRPRTSSASTARRSRRSPSCCSSARRSSARSSRRCWPARLRRTSSDPTRRRPAVRRRHAPSPPRARGSSTSRPRPCATEVYRLCAGEGRSPVNAPARRARVRAPSSRPKSRRAMSP